MLDALKKRLFVARVQAELKAQHVNQELINEICQLPESREHLAFARASAYYRGSRAAPFLAACQLLCAGLDAPELSSEQRGLCAQRLAERLQRAAQNPIFRLQHIMLLDDLESRLYYWEKGIPVG